VGGWHCERGCGYIDGWVGAAITPPPLLPTRAPPPPHNPDPLRRLISRHMRSDASASPPGESTRRTTAATFLSLPRARRRGTRLSGVMAPPLLLPAHALHGCEHRV
jgi:hypothetical protein